MLIRTIPRSRRRSGVAAVELALLLPTVLVPILFGIWEVGRLVQIQQIVENSAREGGRQASTSKYTEDQIKEAVRDYLTNAGMPVVQTGTDGGGNPIYNVTVTVTVTNYPPTPSSPLPNPSAPADDPSNCNQNDDIKIEVSYPLKDVRYLASNFFTTDATMLNASWVWRCVRDLPVNVPTTIPQQLLN